MLNAPMNRKRERERKRVLEEGGDKYGIEKSVREFTKKMSTNV